MTAFAKNNGPGDRLVESEDSRNVELRRRGTEGQSFVPDSQTCGSDALLRITRDLLEIYAYSSLLKVLKRDRFNEKCHVRGVRTLLRHGMARLNMNYKKAAEILQKAVNDDVLTARVAKSLRDTAECRPLALQRLQEIGWTAQVFLSRGDYGNFVVRSAMLLETARRQLAHSLIGLKATTPLVSPNQLDPELNQTLDAAGMYKQNGDWSNTKLFLNTCIEWGKQQLDDRAATEAAAGVQKCIIGLKPLEELRNVFVHHSCGISESDIENHWDSLNELKIALRNLLRNMTELLSILGEHVRLSPNVYAELNEAVLGAMSDCTRTR